MPAESARASRRPLQRPRGLRDLLRSLAGGPGYRGPRSDHFDGERFFNHDGPTGRSFLEYLKWRRTAQSTPWPQRVQNRARPELPARLGPGEVALTLINHVTFLIQLPGLNVLTDPVFAERASPFRRVGPRRVRAPGLAFEALPPIHLVLVSHNHYDHLDIDTLVRLESTHGPRVVTGLGNRAFLESFGLGRVEELDWWRSVDADGISVTLVPAKHWSARSGPNRNRTLWGGFWLRAGGRQILFAGDSGYGTLFAEMRARCGRPDIALLPIGAYEPRWFMQPQHMNPEEAVRAHLDLGARVSVGMHFGCFQLTDEGIDDPVVELAAARSRLGVSADAFQVLETGETRVYRGSSCDVRA